MSDGVRDGLDDVLIGREDADRDERIFRRGMEQGGLGFNTLRTANHSRVTRWHPGFPGGEGDGWTGGDWGNAMAGECGEACNIIKKLRRAEEGFRGVLDRPPDGLKEKLAKELADLVTYADLVAAYYEIDLGEAVREKFNEVSELQGFPERL